MRNNKKSNLRKKLLRFKENHETRSPRVDRNFLGTVDPDTTVDFEEAYMITELE